MKKIKKREGVLVKGMDRAEFKGKLLLSDKKSSTWYRDTLTDMMARRCDNQKLCQLLMESVGNLEKELSNRYANKRDIVSIIEELANLSVCIMYLKQVYDISNNILDRAIDIVLADKVHNAQGGRH